MDTEYRGCKINWDMEVNKGREYYLRALKCMEEKDYNNMSLFMVKSANLGYYDAVKNIYSNDLWMNQDYAVTRPLYEEAAYDTSIVDNSFSLNILGYIYEFGQSVEVDISKAKKLYKMVINKGNYYSMHNLVCIYCKGPEKKYKKGKKLALIAWKMGCIHTIYRLADIYWKMGKHQKAIELYKLSGKMGVSISFTDLGDIYREGVIVEQNYKKSFKYYSKAANQGYQDAFSFLGYMYQNGYGVDVDYKKAKELFEQTIGGAESTAYHNLAFMYEHGQGIQKDYAKALSLYIESSQKGNMSATIKLAELYFDGSLAFKIDQDYEQARVLYERSFYVPNEKALSRLIDIYEGGLGCPVNVIRIIQLCIIMFRYDEDLLGASIGLTLGLRMDMDDEAQVS